MVSTAKSALVGTPLLETKLYAPKWRAGIVSRPRLLAPLNISPCRLGLISAPAGFGKTTLLTEWLTQASESVAWVSLDESDNHLPQFWRYVISAIQQISPAAGDRALSMVRVPQPPPIEAILTALINDLSAVEQDLLIVLDDFHVITDQTIHDSVAFLLDHIPTHARLIIATREDPRLPIARLRVRGQLTELRANDLRFLPEEAETFLNQIMDLHLPLEAVQTLETRTEGWIAGLQLAALSLRGRSNPSDAIHSFAGDDRFVVDYLVDEVLQRQSDQMRRFLLQTSILDRLTGSLCDAVTGRHDGTATLESLERSNLFVVPLDDKRRWYRYHHLFADLLRAHAEKEFYDHLPIWHRRASDWYEAHGFREAAIGHAFAGSDFDRAASLVEQTAISLLGSSQEGILHRWLANIPADLIRARPVLSAYSAFAVFSSGQLSVADARLTDAETWLARAPSESDGAVPGMVVSDESGWRSLRGMIAIARGYLAGALGDLPAQIRYAREAVAHVPNDNHLWRGAASALLGLAYWTSGDLDRAFDSFNDGMRRLGIAELYRFQIACTFILADIRINQGRLNDAARIYDQTIAQATATGDPIWGTADLYVGQSFLCIERNDLSGAEDLLRKSKALGDHAGLAEARYRWFVAMARLCEAQGDLANAHIMLDEAARHYVVNPDPYLRPVAALQARLRVREGNLAAAETWVQERGLSIDDPLTFLQEFEHLTLAHILIAKSRHARSAQSLRNARHLLDRLLTDAVAGQRNGSVIEILVAQALAGTVAGDLSAALIPLEHAVKLAEPDGYVRVFLDAGPEMELLLRLALSEGIAPSYIRVLLEQSASLPLSQRGLVEPLTAREVEIIRLIAAGLRNDDIANRLFISLGTVKRHIANAYGKLGVSHRVEAITEAKRLGLL